MSDLRAKYNLVSPRLALAKMFLLTAGLALGASAGREGSTVQMLADRCSV